MATPIDPVQLGSEHLGRIIDVGWQITTPGGEGFRSSARGVLVNVDHSLGGGTTVTIGLGPVDVTAILGNDSQVTIDG